MEREPQNPLGSASAAGAVNSGNQITERQHLLLMIGLHEMILNREGTRGNYGANRGAFPPASIGGTTTGNGAARGFGREKRKPRYAVGLGNGYGNTTLDDALSDGVADETGHVMDVEIAHEMLSVFVHCFEAHP